MFACNFLSGLYYCTTHPLSLSLSLSLFWQYYCCISGVRRIQFCIGSGGGGVGQGALEGTDQNNNYYVSCCMCVLLLNNVSSYIIFIMHIYIYIYIWPNYWGGGAGPLLVFLGEGETVAPWFLLHCQYNIIEPCLHYVFKLLWKPA